jgi:hypothetical protein
MDGLRRAMERGAVATTATDNGNGRFRVKWETVLGWIIAALLAYGAVDRRVSVLETKYDVVEKQLNEIRADVKELLRRP